MTDATKTDAPAATTNDTKQEIDIAQDQMNTNLMSKVAELMNQVETLQRRISDNQQVVDQVESKNRKRRVDVLEGQQLRDFVDTMLKNNANLAGYDDEVNNMLKNAKDDPHSQPFVELVDCAAKMHAASTAEKEKAYQQIKTLQQQLQVATGTALASTDERFTVESSGLKPTDKVEQQREPPTKRARFSGTVGDQTISGRLGIAEGGGLQGSMWKDLCALKQ